MKPRPGTPRPALEVGTPDQPIPAKHTALIRLTFVNGLDKQSCPAIVCCGGRMDFHGAPLKYTWVRLGATANKGGPCVRQQGRGGESMFKSRGPQPTSLPTNLFQPLLA